MSLAAMVATEFDVPLDRVMLLRHSNERLDQLLAAGSSVEEYTFTQPIGSAYDYLHPDKPPTELVVVIVQDRVYGIFRVLGVEAEGTTYSLTSLAHQRVDEARSKPPRPARRFVMDSLPTIYAGLQITGWEGGRSRTAVQRNDGGFFHAITVDSVVAPVESSLLREEFAASVDKAMADSATARRRRLTLAGKFARRVRVTTWEFVRNPDVVAEVLLRAAGRCERCLAQAPFLRRSDGSPYLEVHHKLRLADGGEDTVGNAIALCPNCHRHEHHGQV